MIPCINILIFVIIQRISVKILIRINILIWQFFYVIYILQARCIVRHYFWINPCLFHFIVSLVRNIWRFRGFLTIWYNSSCQKKHQDRRHYENWKFAASNWRENRSTTLSFITVIIKMWSKIIFRAVLVSLKSHLFKIEPRMPLQVRGGEFPVFVMTSVLTFS